MEWGLFRRHGGSGSAGLWDCAPAIVNSLKAECNLCRRRAGAVFREKKGVRGLFHVHFTLVPFRRGDFSRPYRTH